MNSPKIKRSSLPKNTTIYDYRIEDLLGTGSFGITYKAIDYVLDMPVAIKEYFPADISSRSDAGEVSCEIQEHQDAFEDGKNRFILEARIAAKFNHANIVNVLRYFYANGTAYIVMRYEPGQDLASLMKREDFYPVSESVLIQIVKPVLFGLGELHKADCVHRDIKPSNIYIRETGEPMLLDFGGAQARDIESLSEIQVVTPHYAPIEQYLTTNETIGPASDIYALGATIYRCITTKPPRRSILRQGSIDNDGRDTYVPLASLMPAGYSDELLHLVDLMLSQQQRNRPQSIDEILDKLEVIEESLRPNRLPSRPVIHEELLVVGIDDPANSEFLASLVDITNKEDNQSISKQSETSDELNLADQARTDHDNGPHTDHNNTNDSVSKPLTLSYSGSDNSGWQATIVARSQPDCRQLRPNQMNSGSIIWLIDVQRPDLRLKVLNCIDNFTRQ
ncbi:MAG: serine/threonine protein kinase, partial [Immundisolibacteraceae bacterium]|nr:serine/threonine protein kinase [Immundisolibacteraceae bacterium]